MYLTVFPNREYAVGSLAGVFASLAAVTIMHPIESVKVRMQMGQRGGSASDSRWRRLVGLFHRPYYGVGPHLLQYAALNSIRFGSYAAAKSFFEDRHAHASDGQNHPLPLHEVFQCGAFSGVCIAALIHPAWAVKTHQQINRLTVSQAVLRLWEGEGVRGFFRAYVSGFARFPLALGVFFTAYEALKRPEVWSYEEASGNPAAVRTEESCADSGQTTVAGWLGRAGSGAFAGILCWSSVFPLDLVQSRVIGEATYGSGRLFPTAISGFKRVYRTEGLRGFTRGYSAMLVRSGPVNAVLLPVNDAALPLADRLLPPA
eukprot:TRINITY_DN74566_c0_g1_i1.p1 TRINITY_DN74566_c0_g1~~TRINITY_DN74566_c0_g1_i1.p1  ORF type:complete len:316 (+),score=18.13 TRINITY_DN74566_c0_g1_i1:53-1000(+)